MKIASIKPTPWPFHRSTPSKSAAEYESIVTIGRVISACRLDLLEVNALSPTSVSGQHTSTRPTLHLGVEPFPVTTLKITRRGSGGARMQSLLREAPKVKNLAISNVRSVTSVLDVLMRDKYLIPLLKSLELKEVESPITNMRSVATPGAFQSRELRPEWEQWSNATS
jgi:hypothetical protein